MSATLLPVDRSSARAASASPADVVFDVGDPSALTEAVFRVIADGRTRTLADITRAVGTPLHAVGVIADEIARLRRCGMPIEETGGTVTATPSVALDGAALMQALAVARSRSARAPWEAEVVFATQSTNSDLLSAVRTATPVGPVVRAAELQFAGRGRLGRRWSSAPGTSLTASFALTVRRRLSELDGATLVCGLAVHAVLEDFGVDARLKWPNDVLVDDAKVAGILVEAHATGESSILVIGIGINVTGEADRDARSAGAGPLRRTTLAAVGANAIDRNVLAARLARSLEAHMGEFEAAGFGGFVERWNAVDAFAGRQVTLEATPGTLQTGNARGVDDRGALLIEIDGRRQRIVAGDVSLRAGDEVST